MNHIVFNLRTLVCAFTISLSLSGCEKPDETPVPSPGAPAAGTPAIASPSTALPASPGASQAALATASSAVSAPPALVAGTATKEGWPTEEEAKAAIFKLEHSIRANDTKKAIWHVKDMHHEVKSVKFAERTTQKQMNYGASAVTVYPAKILYTRITEYTDKPATREEEGDDGVWFFYKDSFGEWKCKYGNE